MHAVLYLLFSIYCSLSAVLSVCCSPYLLFSLCCSLSAVLFVYWSLYLIYSLLSKLPVCCFLYLPFSSSSVFSICYSFRLLFSPFAILSICCSLICCLPLVQFSLVAVLLLFSSLVIIVISGSINALFSLLCLLCFVLFRLPPVVVNEINFGLSFILLLSSSISCVNCGHAAAVSCPLYSTLYNCSVFILSLFFHVLRPCSCSRCVGSLQHYCRVCNTQLNSCKQSRWERES